MLVKEVADLAGISVRTLHHYDEIGLLSPDNTTVSGYRIYSQHNLETLQQILFFKELGFPLKEIKDMIYSPTYDSLEALELQRNMLLEKKLRTEKIIQTIDQTILSMKGETLMTNKEKFNGFDFTDNPYEQEARKKWGNKRVDASQEKINQLSNDEKEVMAQDFNSLYKELAAIRHHSPESDEAQQAIGKWYDFLNGIGSYSLEAFKGLGQMYVDDERFTKNIDAFGNGLALFMRDAMAVYTDKINEKKDK